MPVLALHRGRLVAACLAVLALAGCLPFEPAVSKDGRIALLLGKDGPLVVTEPYVAGSARARYHSVAAVGGSPTFSPDGRRLAYLGPTPLGESTAPAMLVAAVPGGAAGLGAGAAPKPILIQRGLRRVRWSPDGRAIAFLHEDPANDDPPPNLSTIDLESGASRLLSPSPGWFFEWAPDGRALAALVPVHEGAQVSSPFANVAVIDIASGNVDVRASTLTDRFTPLRFSPDGSSLRFDAPRVAFPQAGKGATLEDMPVVRWSTSARGAAPLLREEGALPTGTAAAWPNADGSAVLEASRDQIILRTRGGFSRAADADARLAIPTWISPREVLYASKTGWRILDVDGLSQPFVLEPAEARPATPTAQVFAEGAIRLEAARAVVSSREGVGDDVVVTVSARAGAQAVIRAKHAEWVSDGSTLSLRAREGTASFPAPAGGAPGEGGVLPSTIAFAEAMLEAGRGRATLELECVRRGAMSRGGVTEARYAIEIWLGEDVRAQGGGGVR